MASPALSGGGGGRPVRPEPLRGGGGGGGGTGRARGPERPPSARAPSRTIRKSPTWMRSLAATADGSPILRPFTYVPLVLLRSITSRTPFLATRRVCRFEMFPLGRTMSLPETRPMDTSSLSNVRERGSPPFSVIVSLIMKPRRGLASRSAGGRYSAPCGGARVVPSPVLVTCWFL